MNTRARGAGDEHTGKRSRLPGACGSERGKVGPCPAAIADTLHALHTLPHPPQPAQTPPHPEPSRHTHIPRAPTPRAGVLMIVSSAMLSVGLAARRT
eukprot:336583-Chlamydomonas_euryale.AAC.1